MRTERQRAQTRANIFGAKGVFFRDVLMIYLSEFGEGPEEPSLGIKD